MQWTLQEAILSSLKKLTACAAILTCTLGTAALAQSTNSHRGNTAQATQTKNSNNNNAQKAQQVVDQSTNALEQLRSNGDFQNLLKKAKGIFIVPQLAAGAVVVGGSGGTGALLVRNNGRWSDPAFFTIGSISIGAQAGGKAGSVAMLLMTDKAVSSFTQKNNFSLNGNAGLTIVNWSPTSQGSVGKGDVVIWSGQSGLFAGLNVQGSDIVAATAEDHAFYNDNRAGTQEIIADRVTNGSANKLKAALPG
jgi:lipid-binding SYLF domain-containing protein